MFRWASVSVPLLFPLPACLHGKFLVTGKRQPSDCLFRAVALILQADALSLVQVLTVFVNTSVEALYCIVKNILHVCL